MTIEIDGATAWENGEEVRTRVVYAPADLNPYFISGERDGVWPLVSNESFDSFDEAEAARKNGRYSFGPRATWPVAGK